MSSSTYQPYGGGPGIMVFRPTMQEFRDFSAYIKKMEDCGAHKFGIAKVIPPKEWYATKDYDMEKIGKMVIDAPIAQLVTGQQGLYQQYNVQQKPLTVKELKDLAESDKYCPPEGDFEKLERAYWKNITFNPPIYGADVAGSIYDKDVQTWNINHLNTILDLVASERNVKILGVNTAYLYFGMWKTSFAWHTEDMDLYSINYLHFGASKSWYAIPPEHGKRLENLASGFFSGSAQSCSQFLRHKMTVISPLILKKYSIPHYKMTQNEGEFMITFPYGYHAGFNQGFNCAESTNFASHRWIDFGKKAKTCTCRADNVKIEMELFVKKYQPGQYQDYMANRRKKKTSTQEPNDSEKKTSTKKQGKKIKVKRYPPISAVKSIVKEVKKESRQGKVPMVYKKQEKRAIEKAKDFLRKKQTKYVYLEKKPARDALLSPPKAQKEPKASASVPEDSIGKQCGQLAPAKELNHSPTTSLQLEPDQEEKNQQRKLKLLEIKAEMEHEIEARRNKLRKIKQARARRLESRESKQKILKGEQSRSASESKEVAKTIPTASESKRPPDVSTRLGTDLKTGLHGLWVDQTPDFQKEQCYNRILSKHGQSCAVCAYFDHGLAQRMSELQSRAVSDDQQTSTPNSASTSRSTPLVPLTCFFRVRESSGEQYSSSLPNVLPQESKLLSCSNCCVTVHKTCYGIEEDKESETGWICDPCKASANIRAREGIRCEICPLRGGALKMTTNARWAHIACAIAFFDVSFADPKRRCLIDLSSLNVARTKLKCIYCQRSSKGETNNGACVQCVAGKCANSFHVTCSFQNGVPLYSGDWPQAVEFYCNQHAKIRSHRGEKRLLAEIKENDMVYAKHKNGRFYTGRVDSIDSNLYYYVMFEDGSFCHDLPPGDIVNYQPGVLYSNEDRVDVLWTDGIVYPSIIKSHEVVLRYEVIFEDGSSLVLKRNDLYRQDEDLPRKVRAKLIPFREFIKFLNTKGEYDDVIKRSRDFSKNKLSHATETANLLWQPPNIRESPTKRMRIETKKFSKLL